ncbi:MAG: FG-GAP-like repeat-containing protein, partial [Planctomycetota bacterium]
FGNIGQSQLLLGDGRGKFSIAPAGSMPKAGHSTEVVRFADVDRDGDLDLLLGNSGWLLTPEANRQYLNNSKGSFVDVSAKLLPVDTELTRNLDAGDVDADGDLDLVWRHLGVPIKSTRLGPMLYLGDGKGGLRDASATHLPKYEVRHFNIMVKLGDVDGDGDLDLVWSGSAGLALHLNDGHGRFVEPGGSRFLKDKTQVWALDLADVDGDEDLDLMQQVVVIGKSFRRARLWFNLHRQAVAPSPPKLGKPYDVPFWAEPGYAPGFRLVLPFVASGQKRTRVPPYGTFGLDPASTVALHLGVIHPLLASTTYRLQVPNRTSLVSLDLFVQGLIVDSLARRPTTWRLTNVIRDRITR